MFYRGETLRTRISLTLTGLSVIAGIMSACSPTDAREATPSATFTPSATALVETTKTPFEPTPAAVPPAKTVAPKETKSTTPGTPIYPRHNEDLPIINLSGTETIDTSQHLSKEDQQLATYRDSEKSRIYMQLAEGSKTIKQKHEEEIAGFIIGTNWSELQPGEFLTSGFLTDENGVGYEYSYSIVTSNGVEKKGAFTLNPESLPTGTEYIYDTRNHGLLYQGQVSDDGPYTTVVARFDKQQGKVVESEVKFKISQIFNPKTEKWETPSAANGGIINLSGIGGAESPTQTENAEVKFSSEYNSYFGGKYLYRYLDESLKILPKPTETDITTDEFTHLLQSALYATAHDTPFDVDNRQTEPFQAKGVFLVKAEKNSQGEIIGFKDDVVSSNVTIKPDAKIVIEYETLPPYPSKEWSQKVVYLNIPPGNLPMRISYDQENNIIFIRQAIGSKDINFFKGIPQALSDKTKPTLSEYRAFSAKVHLLNIFQRIASGAKGYNSISQATRSLNYGSTDKNDNFMRLDPSLYSKELVENYRK